MLIINRRHLKVEEILTLQTDIKFYPDLIYLKKSAFKMSSYPYVVTYNDEFVGFCAVFDFNDWIKLGPLVLLKKYHGKGYGKVLINKIINDYPDKNIFITSSNIAIQKIIGKLGFKEVVNYFTIPIYVKLFLIYQIYSYISWKMVTEFIRKKFIMKRGPRKYYIRYFKVKPTN